MSSQSLAIQKYTAKSIVVRGDGRDQEIKNLGGKFGSFGGVKGFVFPLTMETQVRNALNIHSDYIDGPSPQPRTVETKSVENENDSPIGIQRYTEKSIVVRGNIRPFVDELKNIGGKWGSFGGEHGWVFPLTKESIVRQTLNASSEVVSTGYVDGPSPKPYTPQTVSSVPSVPQARPSVSSVLLVPQTVPSNSEEVKSETLEPPKAIQPRKRGTLRAPVEEED